MERVQAPWGDPRLGCPGHPTAPHRRAASPAELTREPTRGAAAGASPPSRPGRTDRSLGSTPTYGQCGFDRMFTENGFGDLITRAPI